MYKALILDNTSIDEGFLFENVVAQELRANGHALKYNTFSNEQTKKSYSIDFFLESNRKICPIEVKSSNYTAHKSLDEFCKKYHQYIDKKIVVYSKNFKIDNDVIYLTIYMVMCL